MTNLGSGTVLMTVWVPKIHPPKFTRPFGTRG
jgi:hypothetical protein